MNERTLNKYLRRAKRQMPNLDEKAWRRKWYEVGRRLGRKR